MAGIVTETKRRLLIGKEIKEVQVPTNTLNTSLYLADLASVGATFNSSRIASELGALPAVVKQNASLALIADTYKTGTVYAINGDTKSLEELNFERGSAATYEDASGNIVLAPANMPRINYRNGVLQGWLVEPASTNLLLDSGVANGLASFESKSSVGLTVGASGFNLGSLLANSITISKGSETTYAYKTSSVALVSGKVYTFSFFCRLSDGSAPTSNDMSIAFGGGSNILASWNSISYGNGVYRCYVTGVPVLSDIGYFGIHKEPSSSDKTITVSGFQLEEGQLTSYIPTTTATATRLADKISTKRPTVVFNKNSMYFKTAEYADVWFGNGVGNLNIAGEVGGRNLILGTSSEWKLFSGSDWGVVGFTKVEAKKGETFTGRALVRNSNSPTPITLEIHELDSSFVSIRTSSKEVVNGEVQLTMTVESPNTSYIKMNLFFGGNYGTNTYQYEYSKPKLEKGNKATDWTPAPEDYCKVDANGNIEISYTEPIHIQQFALISRELKQEEVG